MKFFSLTVTTYALLLFVVLSFTSVFAQQTPTPYDDTIGVNSDQVFTDGLLSIARSASDTSNSQNASRNTTASNRQDFIISGHTSLDTYIPTSTLTVNLSSGLSSPLTTNVSLTTLQGVWRLTETDNSTPTLTVSHQSDVAREHQSIGNYYMLVSDTDVFDTTSDIRLLRPNRDGTLSVDFDFEGTNYVTFGFAPQVHYERSLYFDGTDDYIDMGNTLNLNPSGFSVSAWIKRAAHNSGVGSIVSKRDNAFTEGYDLRILNDNKIEIIWNNGAYQSLISSTKLPYDEWHHVAAIYNGSSVSLYIDGVRDTLADKTAPVLTNTAFHIGAAGKNLIQNHFGGNIDEVRLWNIALTEDQLRFIMNQELVENSGQVNGTILPATITKNDIDDIPWSALAAYYPMSIYTYTNINDASLNGIHGTLKHMTTVDLQTAPLPYLSTQNGDWNTKTTWTNGTMQSIPGAVSLVDRNMTVDWNIVKTAHAIAMANSSLPILKKDNRTLLALYVNANTLVLNGNSSAKEGHGLTISHYMSLIGKLDLEGESQLIQNLDSHLDVAPSGALERDQQGPSDTFTYKYWSSPVGKIDIAKNDYRYKVKDVMYDGTQPINFLTSGYDGAATSPIGIADYWIWKYTNQPNNNYSAWQHVRGTGIINAGQGFTMKGPGTGSLFTNQNYVFLGKPNNGDINLTITAENDYLVGNPYPSAIDANQFIIDNGMSNSGTAPTITGTLYFWQHWGGGTHFLNSYDGGYATYNFSGGVAAASYGTNDPFFATGGIPAKQPNRYIPVGQGFFVASKNTGTINFNNGQRVFRKEGNSNNAVTRTNPIVTPEASYNLEDNDDRLKFRIGFKSINTIHRQLLLTIDDNTTSDVDWAFDAKLNEIQVDDMYWLINENAFIIQASNEATSATVYPLGIKTSTDGLNTISIDALENAPNDTHIYVYDIELDLYHDLRNSNYEVFLNAGQYHNRFEITFSTNGELLGVNEETNKRIDIRYSNDLDKLVVINPNLQDIKSITLFNMLGQSVYSAQTILKNYYAEYEISNLVTNAYIIKLTTTEGIITKKIIVQ
jgi:hypothetical protein